MKIQEALNKAKTGDKVRPKSWEGFTGKIYVYFDKNDEKYKLFTTSKVKGIAFRAEPEIIFDDWEVCNFLDIHKQLIGCKF